MIVGHAEILVKAITTGVEKDIRDGFKRAAGSVKNVGEDIGNDLSDGINKGLGGIRTNTFNNKLKSALNNSTQLAEQFTSLARKSYFVQTGLGALVGTISAAVAGLGALVGVAVNASAALVAVGVAGISAKVGMKVLGLGFSGISQAVSQATKGAKNFKESLWDIEEAALNQGRAGLNLEKAREALLRVQDLAPNSMARREAMQAYKEAEFAFRKSKSAEKDAAKSGTDPYAGLTESQKQFAKFLVSLKPKLAELKEAVASGFLPVLEEQMKRLIKGGVFDILKTRFYDIAVGASKAVEAFTDMILSGNNLKNLDAFLRNTAELMPKFGNIVTGLFSGFLSVIRAAEPLTDRFVTFLEKKSGAFAKFLNTKEASGQLTAFFNRAGTLAAQFGKIFGNWFKDIGDIAAANFGPGSGGQKILDWLEEISKSRFDVIALRGYFSSAADNLIAMGNALGGALEIMMKTASNPAIKEFWDTMDSASYAFDTIVREAVEGAPALGRLLKNLVEIFAQISDSGQAIAFLETLNFVFAGIAQTLRAMKPFLDLTGPIFGALSALGLLAAGFIKFTAILVGFGVKAVGSIIAVSTALGFQGLAGALGRLVPAAAASGTAMTLALGPVGLAIAGIVLAVTALVVAFNAIGQANMDKAIKGTTAAMLEGADAAKVWEAATLSQVKGPWKESIASVDQMRDKLNQLGKAQQNWTYSFPYTTALADSLSAIGKSLANVATTDLPRAQAQFKKFTSEVGMSKNQIRIALNEMDEFSDALIKQADSLAINIRNTDGSINKTKLLAFALGEGEYAARQAQAAQDALNTSINDASIGFLNLQGNLTQNKDDVMAWAKAQADNTKDASDSWEDYWDGQSFSMDKYLDDLEEQAKAAEAWKANIAKLTGQLPDEIMQKVVDMGEAGAALVAGLTDGVNDKEERDRFIKSFDKAGYDAGEAMKSGFQKAVPKGMTYSQLLAAGYGKRSDQKNGGYISGFNGGSISQFAFGGFVSGAGTARSDSIPAMLSNGEYVINARATAQNRSLLDAINSNQSVSMAPSISITVNPSPGMDERALVEMVSRKIAFEIRKGTI